MKIKWKNLFDSYIRERGKQYYARMQVNDLAMLDDDVYEATVSGTKKYNVRIALDGPDIAYMSCTCPYAQKGFHCKHMAAVLFEMEDYGYLEYSGPVKPQRGKGSKGAGKSAKTSRKNERVFPFEKKPSENADDRDNYHYYEMSRITKNLVIYEDTLEAAKGLAEDGAVTMLDATEGYFNSEYNIYTGEYRRTIFVRGEYCDEYNDTYPLLIKASYDRIESTECSAPGCHNRTGGSYYYSTFGPEKVCEHITALLLLMDDFIKKYNPGDDTDPEAEDLLNMYRSRRSAGRKAIAAGIESGAKMADVTIEPRLEIDEDDNLKLSFKIGSRKLFVVKDLKELRKAVESADELKLGKKDAVDFAKETFDEASAGIYEFINREIRSEQLRDLNARQNFRYGDAPVGETIKNTLSLYGKRLDDFFELFKDRRMEFVHKTSRGKKTGEIILRDRQLKARLYLDPVLDETLEFAGVSLNGELPKMVNGVDAKYFFDGKALNRAGSDSLEILDILRRSASEREIDVVIGRRNLAEFWYRVLPEIRTFADIEVRDAEVIKEYLYPEAEFAFYLDAEDDNVICDAKVKYGSDECGLYDNIGMEKTPEAFRDIGREKEITEMLEGFFPYIDPETKHVHCNADEDLIYSVLDGGVDALAQVGEVQATDRFRGLTIRRKPQITVGVKLESDLLNLSITSDGMTEDDLLELISSYRKRKKYHRLKNGDFMAIDDDSLEELSNMLDVMHVSPSEFVRGKMQLPLYRALYLDRMLEKNDTLYSKRDKHFRSLIREFKTVSDSDYEIPESLQDIMRNYQQFGYKWLRTVENCGFGGILADDMGLGKTLQVIAVLLAAREEADRKAELSSPACGNIPGSVSALTAGETGGSISEAFAASEVERLSSVCDADGKDGTGASSANTGSADAPAAVNGDAAAAEAIEGFSGINGISAGTSLVVTPASLVYNWSEEFAKFAPQLKICVIAGTKTERSEKLKNYSDYDVLITSYDLLKRDILNYEDKTFSYQIIDEAQFIKNHTTAAAKAVKVVNSRVHFALTGTPIENRLSELWSIFDYLMPGFLYTYDRFRRELENPIVKDKNEAAMTQLKRMVEPFILRRLKGEVLRDLPEKIEEVQYVAFEKAQQQLYDGQAVLMKRMLQEQSDESFAKSKIKILAEITRIRQICCDPSLCYENYKGESAKREACLELINSAIDGEHKMLVFSQFTSMLELLEADLKKAKIPYYKITGATKKEERLELVRSFNEDDTPVFLISLKAGGTGLNLTGADIVIHYDPWWNLAAQNQATDRAHRIGQEKTVSVYRLIVKGSIEEKILKLQENKKALADEILSGETGGLMTMSREDLMALL